MNFTISYKINLQVQEEVYNYVTYPESIQKSMKFLI